MVTAANQFLIPSERAWWKVCVLVKLRSACIQSLSLSLSLRFSSTHAVVVCALECDGQGPIVGLREAGIQLCVEHRNMVIITSQVSRALSLSLSLALSSRSLCLCLPLSLSISVSLSLSPSLSLSLSLFVLVSASVSVSVFFLFSWCTGHTSQA